MSWFYRWAYRLGIAPWEGAATRGAAHIAQLFDREQQGRERPFGRALDLGCGRGLQSVDLAARGWRTTGVDGVPRALDAARERARQAGVEVEFVQGDVTALRASGIRDEYQFFLDIGCFHGLNDQQRIAMGRAVDDVAAPDATLLMLAWGPGSRAPLPRGASQADIEAAFPNWKVIDVDAPPLDALPKPMRGVNPRFYRLRKSG